MSSPPKRKSRAKPKRKRKAQRARKPPVNAAAAVESVEPVVASALQHLTVRQAAFLEAFAASGNVSKSAIAAGITRQTHYDWLRTDAAYVAGMLEVAPMARDVLIDEARRRAVDGVPRLKFHEGSVVMVPDPSGKMVPNPYAKMVLNAEGKFEQALTPAMVPYVEHHCSDMLLSKLIDAEWPEKFGKKVLEHTGNVGITNQGAIDAAKAEMRQYLFEHPELFEGDGTAPADGGEPAAATDLPAAAP